MFETNTGNIPEKLVGVEEIEIQFSLKHTEYEINPIPEAILYNYLPTKVNLGFSFLINSDFIPTGDRHYLFENEWNKYLMKEVGIKLFEWFITLHSVKHKSTDLPMFKKDYLKLLPNISNNIQELKSKSSNNLFLLEAFKEGFEIGLLGNELISARAFIPTQNGELETLSNILIDETGIAELLKNDFFKITGITQKLINKEVGEGIEKVKALINEYKYGVIYTVGQFKNDLKTTLLQDWLKISANNFKIIQYLFNNKELKSLLKTEKIVLSESKELFTVTDLYNTIPDEVAFMANNKIEKALNAMLVKEEIELDLKPFNASEFYKANFKKLNLFLTNESNIINVWHFIYDNWTVFKDDDEIKKSLHQLFILCKPIQEGVLNIRTVSSVYVPKEFAKEGEVETIIATLNLTSKYFIENKFCSAKRPDTKKWNDILRSSKAKSGLRDVITELVIQLPNLDDALHFKASIETFNYWKANKEKSETQLTQPQINLIEKNLKIQCLDNKFYTTNDCIISDHYNNNQLIASWLPILELPNQVSNEYAPKTNYVGEWKNFLIFIGCIELADKQNVFEAKMDFFINSQGELKEKHYEILKSLSDLYKANKENGINFNENVLSKINLQTSKGVWQLPNNIHLSNEYKPKLNLQNENSINFEINFLNDKYNPTLIEKYFLTDIGVNDGFIFKNIIPIIHIDKIKELKFSNHLQSIEKYRHRVIEIKRMTSKDTRGYSIRTYPDEKIRLNTFVNNHILINYPDLLTNSKFADVFLKYVIKNKKIDILSTKTEIRIWNNNIYAHPNYLVWLIQSHDVLKNQNNELVKTSAIYSYKFSNYIINKAELPELNYTGNVAENGKTLEEILGIQQHLNESHCIELLSRTENRITIEEIKQLQIVEILSNYTPNDDERSKLFLFNSKLEWKPLDKLFISADEQFQIDVKQELHEHFIPLVVNFGIQELSEENLILKTTPKSPDVTDEIEKFFKSKAKFIAFKIDQSNYETVAEELIQELASFEFYEVSSIAKVFPETNPIYKLEIDYYFDEAKNKVFFQGNWKTNKEVIEFIFSMINSEIERKWFENVINRWEDKKIIETLIDLFGSVPPEWIGNFIETDPIEEPQITSNHTYKQEVFDFINELENNEWSEYIPELKNILELSISHPKEKQKLFNLIAKLKLAKDRNIHFEKNMQEFNQLSNETEKYFVHSARGSFAYIHTNEILRMKNEGYKMALDFGSKSEIKIYETAEEILQLNTNHLLLYQYEKPIEALISFCEANKEASKHLLIVDRDNSRDKSKELHKLLNPEDDYQ